MRVRGPCKSEPSEDILGCDDVSPRSVDDLLDRVEANTMPWVQCFEIKGFSRDFLTIALLSLAEVGEFCWYGTQASKVSDESANGLWFGANESMRVAKLFEQ